MAYKITYCTNSENGNKEHTIFTTLDLVGQNYYIVIDTLEEGDNDMYSRVSGILYGNGIGTIRVASYGSMVAEYISQGDDKIDFEYKLLESLITKLMEKDILTYDDIVLELE